MQLTCPTRDDLREFLDGSMADNKSKEITAHINECSSCDEVLSSLENEQNSVLQIVREGARTESLLLEPEFEQLRDTFRVGQDDTTPGLPEDEQLEPGRRLRDYRLVRKIGEGGMGTVYQAVHIHLAKPVAVKILPADKLQSKQSVSRFRQEMRAVGRVNHANVVSASDAGKIDGQHFLVMELVEGADLARIIQGQGALSVADACEIVRQTAIGLQHAHDSGLIHRDVKPSNVMLATDGNVKLLDLGLAGLNKTEFESTSKAAASNRLTSFGQIMGTLDYMAPEQVTASPDVDVRADIYALGATLFQLLTGKTPCGNRSQETSRRIEAILNEPPADISKLRDDIPAELQALLLKMLAKHPQDRPQAASDVASEIASFASGSNLVALAEASHTSLDIPSADVEVTDDASFLFSHTIAPQKEVTRRKPLTAIGLVGFFFALIAASVFFFVTNNGIIKVEVFDEDIQVSVDGETLRIDEEGNSEVTKLWASNDHQIIVSLGGKELITESFEMRRGEKLVLQVEYLEGKMLLQNGGRQLGAAKLTEEQIAQAGLGPASNTPGTTAEDWQTRISNLVNDNPIVVVAKLGKGHFTGRMNVHRVEPTMVLKGRKHEVKSAFANLAFTDDFLPLDNRRPSHSMPELLPGEYLLVLKAEEIAQSSAVSTFGFTITPDPVFNFTIARDGRKHAAWPKDSQEAKFVLALLKTKDGQVSSTSPAAPSDKEMTLADLSDAELALVYKQITGAELAEGFVSGPDLASSVNILLGYSNVSREKIAENLVKLGKPEVAKIVLSSGRVDPAATEALKLGNLLMESGDAAKAIDVWLTAYRIAPTLFDWERIKTFDEHKRLQDLAEVFTEERIRKTSSGTVTNMHFLLKRLMKDDLRTSVGMPFMTRLWKARPDIRAWIVDETKWDEVPDRADYFAQLLIPEDVEKVGNGWGAMFGGGVHGGWLFDLRKILDEPTTRELIARVRPKVEEHKSWVAGPALLAVLEALNGNCEPAKRFLKEKGNKLGMSWQHAQFLGLYLQGKDRELDGQIISLYESCLAERNPKSPYRASRVHELAKLYHKFGRKQDSLNLMYGLVERERKAEEYLVENWGRAETVNLDHERIWDLRTAVETLNSIGYPLDSLTLLSRVTFEQRRAAGVYKGGGWEYNDENIDESTSKSQKLLNANSIVEALNRGVIPIGLASTINEKSGEIENPIVELLAQLARKELSDEVAVAFESVNPKLTDPEVMDQHLGDLIKQHPANVDIAVAAAIFAFQRNDIETAKGRLEVVDSSLGADHKARAADLNLHVAWEYAEKHQATAEIGERLSERAAKAGKQMREDWKRILFEKHSDKKTRCLALFRECLDLIDTQDVNGIFKIIADGGESGSFKLYPDPDSLSPKLKEELQDVDRFFQRNFKRAAMLKRLFDTIQFSGLETANDAVSVTNTVDGKKSDAKLHSIRIKIRIPETDRDEAGNLRFLEIKGKLYWIPFGW